MNKLKSLIKSIPIIGWLSRWSYNILKINNTKHRLHSLEDRFNKLSKDFYKLNQEHIKLNKEHYNLKVEFKNKDDFYDNLVRKHISTQLIYFHQKVDKFIENSNQQKIINFKDSIDQDFFDEYYLNFENKFRGNRNSILQRYEKYLDFIPFIDTLHLNNNIKALDIGCGRGEWVQLLQDRNVNAYGVDLNPMMLNVAKQNNIKNIEAVDAFVYLDNCEDNSFDLITAFHIIEHIPFEKLVHLLQQVKRVAKPNATILLETPNPENLKVASCNFYTDPTHLNPLPADMIKFLVEYIGFDEVQINYINPNTTKQDAQDYLIKAKNSLSPYEKEKKNSTLIFPFTKKEI